MIIEEITDKILATNACDRPDLVMAIVRNSLRGHIDSKLLLDRLAADYKQEVLEDLTCQDAESLLDEYCDTYTFDLLIDELASRRTESQF